MNEYTGAWERRGLIRVPVIEDEPNRGGRPRKVTPGAVGRMVDLITWTPETLRAAHAAFERGNRDVYTLAGNREYNRRRPRRTRLLSQVDREWAEKNVVKSSWELDTRTNRSVSVSNTT